MRDSEETGTPDISTMENGPLLVKNLGQLANSKGEQIEVKPVMALCRCGHSAKKPFCDGSHSRMGFSSEIQSDPAQNELDHYTGKGITIQDNRSICAHAGLCTERLAAVFRLKEEPWIDPDGASVEEIVALVEQCPSGALSYTLQGQVPSRLAAPASILVAKDGPYHVLGPVSLDAIPWGNGADRERYALCRCGASKNKPFCDGSHWGVNFKDEDN